jgi:hypothetical protein
MATTTTTREWHRLDVVHIDSWGGTRGERSSIIVAFRAESMHGVVQSVSNLGGEEVIQHFALSDCTELRVEMVSDCTPWWERRNHKLTAKRYAFSHSTKRKPDYL